MIRVISTISCCRRSIPVWCWGTLLAALLQGAVAAAPEEGLVAGWDFDAGQGTVLLDRSGNHNDGAIHGAAWVKSGKGFALKFDGQDDYIDCGNDPSLDLTGPLTIQAWVQPTAANKGEPGIAGKFFESYALTYYGSAYFYISSGGNNLCVPTKMNSWAHVAGTFDGHTMRMYLNGEEIATKESKFRETKRGHNFYIGCIFGDPSSADPALQNTSFFPGLIDGVRVHNRALSPAEILQDYSREAEAKGLKPFDMKLVGHFQLEPFFYPEEDRAVLSIHSRWALPLPSDSNARVELLATQTQKILQTQLFNPLAPRNEDEVEFSLKGLVPGEYELRVVARKPEVVIPAERPVRKSPSMTTYTEGWLAGRMDLYGGWAEYEFNVPEGRYGLTALAANIYDSAGVRCTIDGKDPTEINLNGTEGGGDAAWQKARWATVGAYNLSAGAHTLRVETIPAYAALQGKTHAIHVYIDGFALESLAPPKEAGQIDHIRFRYPREPPPPVPAPRVKTVEPLPTPVVPPAYRARLAEGGGIELEFGGRVFHIESRYSYPDGGGNRLVVGTTDRRGEPAWKVRATNGTTLLTAQAAGKFYRIEREVTVEKTRLLVRDTIRNLTDDAAGIIIANGIVTAGLEAPKVTEMTNPTIFVGSRGRGVGLIALDDLYQCQVSTGVLEGRAEVRTEHFGLDKDAAYTLEWAIYPTATADYFDFINQVRKDEGLNRRVEGAFAFVGRRDPPSPEMLDLKNLKYTSIGCLGQPEDNPAVPLEGFEFMEYPKECALLKETFAKTKALYPGVKVMFHVAHGLHATNKPNELFADSRILDANGGLTMYGGNSEDYYRNYFTKELFDAGWRWYLFYPTLENRFGKAMIRAMEYMVNEIGATGMWADGYFCGYAQGGYSYDRWDGHSVTIDPNTKRIVRKKTCVPYVAIPVLVKVARIISEKGGVLVSNDVGGPRSIWKEDIITSCETGGGDARPVGGLHLGRTVTPLGNPLAIQNGRDVYRDILTKLDLGALYFWYGDYDRLKYKTLVERMYPITFDSIHGGTVRGLERIVTKKSGVYGWKGDRSLHCVYRYDARGALTRSDCLTTVDKDGVRTEVNLADQQSAAVVKIPCRLTASAPVNVCVRRYDKSAVLLEVNGTGKVNLCLSTGDFPVQDGRKYRVTIGGKTTDLTPKAGELHIELHLQGPATLSIAMP